MSNIEMDLDDRSVGSVKIDGAYTAKYATHLSLYARAGEPPRLEVEYLGDVHGDVHVQAEGKVRTLVYIAGLQGIGHDLESALTDVLRQVTDKVPA